MSNKNTAKLYAWHGHALIIQDTYQSPPRAFLLLMSEQLIQFKDLKIGEKFKTPNSEIILIKVGERRARSARHTDGTFTVSTNDPVRKVTY